jgi:hypothetical protein
MTSTDGTSWSPATGEAHYWNSVTYGNGTFVAVGVGNVMTSTDGVTWTTPTYPSSGTWDDVIYGNGLFVAIGEIIGPDTDSYSMVSTNGTTWQNGGFTGLSYGGAAGITYGNDLFVVVSNDSGNNNVRIAYSGDGINWLASFDGTDDNWTSVTYGNGLFVAVSDTGTGNRVMTMSPPINWGGSLANNYGTAIPNANDPTQGGSPAYRNQQYVTNNNFTNYIDTATGEYGMFDFDLDLSRAAYESSYCFRVTKSDGSTLASYSSYPEITRCTVPSLERRLRHAQAFCGGSKRNFWSRAGV